MPLILIFNIKDGTLLYLKKNKHACQGNLVISDAFPFTLAVDLDRGGKLALNLQKRL
jgi:hypothetical protein